MADTGKISFFQVHEELISKEGPTQQTLNAAFEAAFAGSWSNAQIAALVIGLEARGMDVQALVAASTALRAAMVPVEHGLNLVVDTCGTGGDGKHSINISTVGAIIVAACGLPVAKHGGGRISSRCGSADVLEALGIPLTQTPARHAEILKQAGITFLSALDHHPIAGNLASVLRELAIPTLINTVGAVNSPAHATHQLLGVYDDKLRPIVAGALLQLGTRAAWVVRSEDGLDEISPYTSTRVTELRQGTLRERVISPEDFGLPVSPAGAISGGDAAENAARILTILRTQDDPATDAVILNAAAALAIAQEATAPADLRQAALRAREALQSGAALRTLEAWRAAATATV